MSLVAEIDLGAIARNIEMIADHTNTPVCAVVKADGYGHGAAAVAQTALASGATWLAVATIGEAVEVGPLVDASTPILVLSERPPAELEAFGDRLPPGLRLTVGSAAGVGSLAQLGRALVVHLKIDTGMHRMGVSPDEVVALARALADVPSLRLEAVWTHLATADGADGADRAFTDLQLDRFDQALSRLDGVSLRPPLAHVANSAAAIAHRRSWHGLIRLGIAMYGVAPSPALDGVLPLSPALALKAPITAVRSVHAADGVSYGRAWTAPGPARIATVPIGYADGVRRASGAAGVEVLIGGRRCPIVGNVTMDQCMVMVDGEAEVGDDVVFIGTQGGLRIGVNEIASRLGTVGYEVLTSLGPRIKRASGGE